jgi:hypothetical protein
MKHEASEGEDVRTYVDEFVPASLFGGHVTHGSEQRAAPCEFSLCASDAGDTEVEKFWFVDVAIDENDVSRREIAMDDAVSVCS